jgi:fatty acyl-CoA reductase
VCESVCDLMCARIFWNSMHRVQQKISQGLDVLTFFTTREWDFDSTQYQRVFDELDDDDKEM